MNSPVPHITNPPIPNSQHQSKGESEVHNDEHTDLVSEFYLEWKQGSVEKLTVVAAEDADITIVHGNPLIKFSSERMSSDGAVTEESERYMAGVEKYILPDDVHASLGDTAEESPKNDTPATPSAPSKKHKAPELNCIK